MKKSALLSASFMLPEFLRAFGLNGLNGSFNGKRLVVIQLFGGNDGLNCIVPFRNDLYYKLRPGIGLKDEAIIGLTDEVAMNANLAELADLFNQGQLSVINNVGYPDPNRSHFRSTDIWHSASDESQYLNTGWIGRYLDSFCTDKCNVPHTAIELDDTLSLILKGDKTKGIAFHDPKVLFL
ncbi:MAG: twin-arginine translocation pathway signal, partial [Crocinitomicaceae bacterium]|nr:twin-arginine translocation pathway signal [Crocinitomicaceae bacterium]